MLQLRTETSQEWVDMVFSDFDVFLVEHAACERKAFSTNMSFVVKYPDRTEILEPMINIAKEELDHFHQVYKILAKRGLTLQADKKDEYVLNMLKHMRSDKDQRFLDRMLISGVVEARGCERLGLISKHIQDPELKDFYFELVKCEARHHGTFIRLAGLYFDEKVVDKRLNEFLDFEAEAIAKVPLSVSLF